MKSLARLLLLAGAAAAILAAFSPWADVNGPLDLGLLGVDTPLGGKTVSGIDTPAWPVLLGIGGVVVALTLSGKLMKLMMLFGLLLTLGGIGLIYYVSNAVDIETKDDPIKQAIAERVVDVKAQPGPFLILGSGVLILAGAALAKD